MIDRKLCVVLSVLCLEANDAGSSSLFAQTQMDSILERLTKLEHENKELRERFRQLAGERHKVTFAGGIASSTTSTTPPSTSKIRTLADEADAAQRESTNWRGIYGGAAFGGSAGSSKSTGREIYRYDCTGCSPPDNLAITSISSQGGASIAPGGFGDLFIGYNALSANKFVFGIQADGDFGAINFGSKGTRSYTFFDASGALGGGKGSFDQRLSAPWMLTGIFRGGALADPQTLLYGIAGWTVAQLNVPSYSYNSRFDGFINSASNVIANGPTIGAGIERKLDTNWSIIAEYRYTHFLPYSLNQNSAFSGSSVAAGSDVAQTKFRTDVQTVRVGVSYFLPTDTTEIRSP